MSKVDDDKVKALIHSIGLKYGLQDEVIRKIVNSPCKFARETITSLEIANVETQEEFDKLRVNFILKYWGKLYTSLDRIKRLEQQSIKLKEHNKNIKWKNKET